jgi:sugar phosphate isomerase/epimerase
MGILLPVSKHCGRGWASSTYDSPKGQWRHDPIGAGAVDFAAIGALLRRKGFEGAVVLEILSGAPLRGLTDGVAALQALGFSFQETIKRIDG